MYIREEKRREEASLSQIIPKQRMGFPVACAVIVLPNFFLQFLSSIALIRTLILTLLRFLGLSEYHETGSSSPQYSTRPGSVPVSVIRDMLPVVKFSAIVSGAGGEETPESCAVCLVDFEPEQEIRRLRNCTHVFHRCCLDRWMDHDQMTCPLCRTPFILPESVMPLPNYI